MHKFSYEYGFNGDPLESILWKSLEEYFYLGFSFSKYCLLIKVHRAGKFLLEYVELIWVSRFISGVQL